MSSSSFLRITIALVGVVTAACHGYDPAGPGDPQPYPNVGPVAVQGVRVTPQSIHLGIGETLQLEARIAPLDATDQTLVWVSTDSTLASVDAGGLVTGLAPGIGVLVTAFTGDGGYESSVNVTVLAGPVAVPELPPSRGARPIARSRAW